VNLTKNNFLTPLLLAILFFVIFTTISISKHQSFQSNAFDLGIHTQAIYLYSQGLTPFSTLKHMLVLGDHFGIALVLLAPLYRFFPSSETLLILQALFVSLSSIPIYLITQDKLKSSLLSLLITLSYLTSVGITSAINFDFHLATISVLPLSFLLYGWYFKKWNIYWVSLILSLLTKEDTSILIFGLGIYKIFLKQTRSGIATLIVSFFYFLIVKFMIMPFFWKGAEQGYISTSALPLTNPLELIVLFFSRPGIFLNHFFNSPIKQDTFDNLYKQYAYLPILNPLSWFTVFPSLYLRFSSTATHFWTTIWHYNANLEPFLAISTVFAISKFRIPIIAVALLLIFFLFYSGLSPNSLIWRVFYIKPSNIQNNSQIYQSLQIIPANASVSAQNPFVPYLANRQRIYLFPEIYDSRYIIVKPSLSSYPTTPEEIVSRVNSLISSSYWGIEYQNQDLIILKKTNSNL